MNKHFLPICLVVAITIVLCPGMPGISAQDFREFPPGLQWKQIETEHFIIVFDEEYRDVARRVAGMAEPIHQDVTEWLQYAPSSKTYVILVDHVDYINGYATPIPNNRIVLYLREPGAGNAFFGLRSPDWLSLVLTHEYTHIVQLDMVHKWSRGLRKIFGRSVFPNLSLPMWMIEGLAVYTETKWQDGRGYHPYYAMMMRTEILEDNFKTLDQMAAIGLRKWPMGTIYYLYGYFFLQYLSETYGEESIVRLNLKNSGKPLLFGGNIFKKVYNGKKEKNLWREWRDTMKQRYEQQITKIRSNPVTETRPLSKSGYFTTSPLFSPDSEYVYYLDIGPHDSPALGQLRLSDGKITRLTEGEFSGDFSISADGQSIYFCQTDVYRTFSAFSDLYALDVKSKKVRRLTKGMRAFDPAVSPDGQTLIFTTTEAGNMNLMRMDLESKTITPILEPSDHTQIAHPVFSSDGKRIAAQIWKEGGFQDIYVMNSDGSDLFALTFDTATDSSPAWEMDDEYIFFSSDRTGTPNIFAYSLKDKTLYQVTNVLTGVFQPDIDPEGSRLVLARYSGNGMDIHLTELNQETWRESPYRIEQEPEPTQYVAEKTSSEARDERRYSPLSSLLPTFWMPTLGGDEDGLQLGIMTAGRDVLGHHMYYLSTLYGIESERMGVFGEYVNQQFYPTVTLFGSDTANLFDEIFEDDNGNKEEYWQREQLAGIDVSFPVYRSRNFELDFSTGYQYKKIKHLTETDTLTPMPDEGVLSGISAGLRFESLDTAIYSISPEGGVLASLTYRHDDRELGSDYDLNTVVGDSRVYLKIPKLRHHVLALRTVGGTSDGDTLSQGIFQLGGYEIDWGIAELEQQQFFLRGYEDNALSGNRFALGSAEYRFPIWYPQRGIGKGWVFFDSLVGTVFYDIGNAWDGDTTLSEFKDGVGTELRLNLGLQHGMLPLTFRLGFAQGLDDDIGESQFIYGVTFNFGL